jgi:hypothetical protein
MDANQRSFGERGQSASLPAEKRFSSRILNINSEVRDPSIVRRFSPARDRSKAPAPPPRKRAFQGLQAHGAILLRCSNQPRRFGTPFQFCSRQIDFGQPSRDTVHAGD